MARHGDGLYLRGKSWHLDCQINGVRYQVKLGKHISRSVAKELALVMRAQILRGRQESATNGRTVPLRRPRRSF